MPNAAPITGTFLAPGVSKNGRLYDKAAIGKAVQRMQERIADPAALPITMRTHHSAGDDSTKIAAVVTGVALKPDGTATWEAAPVGTQAGKDIAAASRPGPDGKRALAAVSIRGWWVGPVGTTEHNGQQVETADDLEIDGIDFTASPGVDAARIQTFETQLAAEAAPAGRTPITESVEAHVADEITDQATTTEATVTYADPGYQDDKKNRYPIDTKAHVQAAWAFVNQTANQKPYTAAQVTKIKAAIKAAAKTFGVNITSETAADLADVVEATISIYHDAGRDSLSMSKHGVDPNNIDTAATQVGSAAKAAAQTMGTDNSAGCGSCGADTPDGANYCPNCGAMQGTPETTEGGPSVTEHEEKQMADDKNPAPKADAKATESTDGKPAGDVTETAKPDEKVTETKPVTETQPVTEQVGITEAAVQTAITEAVRAERESIVADLAESLAAKVTEAKDAIRAEIVATYGPPPRTGLVAKANESTPDKPVHEMDSTEFQAYQRSVLDSVMPTPRV